ncbi:hypothetical protein [Parapedobacter tibetensis]|uniref:hypothetical protein n=1 Tax=Parapedobacter tibetensis TaxID=2972951 RepID=UPI00214D7E14|nr:hypothetical protein [Parapedobacter tibetensis]
MLSALHAGQAWQLFACLPAFNGAHAFTANWRFRWKQPSAETASAMEDKQLTGGVEQSTEGKCKVLQDGAGRWSNRILLPLL